VVSFEPLLSPILSLLASLDVALQLGDIKFLCKLSEDRTGCCAEANQIVPIE
jgi:hypothetical protein